MTTANGIDTIKDDRDRRMAWWRAARFGMFVHWGLYSQLGRHEWVMNRERIPVEAYEKLADTWKPIDRPAREWARLAKASGMKYMVLTTKHHEGFSLWDSQLNPYNAVKRGPGRDLVREYVEACREAGLKVGFYYSLMDWHHPDGAACVKDEAARRRFIDYTHGLVRELMTQYGKIDILWYDVAWPLKTPELWESARMNAMVRQLQPDIILNNRSHLPEDFGTPEEHVTAENEGRDWEACMTFNGSWGYLPSAPAEDWHSSRAVLGMVRTAAAGQGNLLLNIGPKPDGSVPELAVERLQPVGPWLARNAEAVYGTVDRADRCTEGFLTTGSWTVKGNVGYYWCHRWPGEELAIGGIVPRVQRVSLLGWDDPLPFEQRADRLVIGGLPAVNPDTYAAITVVKIECDGPFRQILGDGCVIP